MACFSVKKGHRDKFTVTLAVVVLSVKQER